MSDPNSGSVDPGSEDLRRAIRLVDAIGGLDSDVRAIRITGNPWSKSRPRHTRTGRTYSKPEDVLAEAKTREALASAFAQPLEGNIAVACLFYRANRQRIDADNLLKHVCDSATGPVWEDDSQVTAIVGILELDVEHPRTVVAFAPHVSTLTRGIDRTSICQKCGDSFVVTSQNAKKKYCSNSCIGESRGSDLMGLVPCEHCQELFKRRTTSQKLCSNTCRVDALTNARRASAIDRPYSKCTVCDKQLAHRRGGTCRDCWKNRCHLL